MTAVLNPLQFKKFRLLHKQLMYRFYIYTLVLRSLWRWRRNCETCRIRPYVGFLISVISRRWYIWLLSYFFFRLQRLRFFFTDSLQVRVGVSPKFAQTHTDCADIMILFPFLCQVRKEGMNSDRFNELTGMSPSPSTRTWTLESRLLDRVYGVRGRRAAPVASTFVGGLPIVQHKHEATERAQPTVR